MTFISRLKSLLLLLPLVIFVSCGSQKPMVDSIKVKPHLVDDELIVSMTADLSIGNLILPVAGIPIYLPKTGEEVGLITLQTTPEGVNQIHVEINVSDAIHLEAAVAKLPNGTLLPIVGNNKVLDIPVGKGVHVYLSLTETSAALGVAVPIKSFDSIGAKTGTAALMPIFNKNDILGAAGIYTSKTAGQNGFAIVADLSNVLSRAQMQEVGVQMQQQESFSEIAVAKSPRRSVEKRINRELYKMHKRGKRLQLR